MNPRDETTFIFMVGTGRCGSTVLAQIVCSHPEVGFVSKTERLLPRISRGGRSSSALFGAAARTTDLASQLRRTPGRTSARGALMRARTVTGPWEAYDLLAREVSPMIVAPFRDLVAEDAMPWVSSRFEQFFARRARAQKKPVFFHKFTGWPRARFINAIFPDAKFIHVVRDGRAVANSLLQVGWWRGWGGPATWTFGSLSTAHEREWEASGRSFAVLAGLEWKILMDAFSEAKSAIPEERWLDVTYEGFVENPLHEIQRIFDFLGVSCPTDIEERLSAWDVRTTRKEAYRHDLSHNDLNSLRRVLAGELERWGYV